MALLVLGMVTGCIDEPDPPIPRTPQCEPRSHTEPARLSIDTTAEYAGMMPNCALVLELYIPERSSSSLRFVTVNASASVSGIPEWRQDDLRAELFNIGAGMNGARISPQDIPDRRCRELEFRLDFIQCLDEDSAPVECPEIRVKRSLVLADLEVTAADTEVCYVN